MRKSENAGGQGVLCERPSISAAAGLQEITGAWGKSGQKSSIDKNKHSVPVGALAYEMGFPRGR